MESNKCWIYKGTKDKDGYGRVPINHDTEIRAHRLSYKLFKGKIGKGLFVCHICDNPSCINPDHLFLGTALENNRDTIKKGRENKASGEKHGMSKLKLKEVKTIRGLYEMGYTQLWIAKQFSVSRELVSQIVLNKIWI